jgi:hypothetical protein
MTETEARKYFIPESLKTYVDGRYEVVYKKTGISISPLT